MQKNIFFEKKIMPPDLSPKKYNKAKSEQILNGFKFWINYRKILNRKIPDLKFPTLTREKHVDANPKKKKLKKNEKLYKNPKKFVTPKNPKKIFFLNPKNPKKI